MVHGRCSGFTIQIKCLPIYMPPPAGVGLILYNTLWLLQVGVAVRYAAAAALRCSFCWSSCSIPSQLLLALATSVAKTSEHQTAVNWLFYRGKQLQSSPIFIK